MARDIPITSLTVDIAIKYDPIAKFTVHVIMKTPNTDSMHCVIIAIKQPIGLFKLNGYLKFAINQINTISLS